MGDKFYSWAHNCEMRLLPEDYEKQKWQTMCREGAGAPSIWQAPATAGGAQA